MVGCQSVGAVWIEGAGTYVRTCDGLAANSRLFGLHNPGGDLVHKVPNPYANDGRDSYFLADQQLLVQ